jgi:hypothetical protein
LLESPTTSNFAPKGLLRLPRRGAIHPFGENFQIAQLPKFSLLQKEKKRKEKKRREEKSSEE